LIELALLRIIDREQAQLLCGFRSITRANTRLLALTWAGLLNRFFIGTFSGGKKSLYALSRKGASLIGAAGPTLQRRRNAVLVGDRFEYDKHPADMAEHARRLKAAGVDLIGACCGSTPEHLQAMREALAG